MTQVKLLVYEKPKLLESEVNAFLSELKQKGQVCHSIQYQTASVDSGRRMLYSAMIEYEISHT